MGVTGLLRLLQPYSTPREASHFRGQTLGVDGYSWLHRAAASCADELLRGVASPRLVQSIDNRVRCYEHHGVQLYFVFDGSSLAMKQRVEAQRRRARQAARAQSEASGSASASLSLRGVDITATHAAMIIAYLKARGIKFVVAPYEADAQLVWLEQEGLIDGIISEDSDLLVFGARNLLTKCDARTGACVHISSAQIPPQLGDLASLRALAIISGCDYSPGVSGLGPVKTSALVTKFGGSLEAVVQHLIGGGRVGSEFAELAQQADLAFQYQRVWNPRKCCLTHLNEPAQELIHKLTDAVIGRALSRAEAHRLAVGLVDPLDLSTELVVDPVIARYVQRMKPIQPAKQSFFTSPLGVSKAANRRLNSMPSPRTPSVSRYFASSSSPKSVAEPRPKSPLTVDTKQDLEANKENTLGAVPSGSTLLTPQRSLMGTSIRPTKSDTIVDSPLGIKNSRDQSSYTPVKRPFERDVGASSAQIEPVTPMSTESKLASIRKFAFQPSGTFNVKSQRM